MTKRAHISLKTKLASALLQLCDASGHRLVPYEDAKQMTADQIVSLFAFDHYPIPKGLDGPDEPWNLDPRMLMEHRVKTATYDVPVHAKGKRITKREEEFRRRLLAKDRGEPKPRSRWPKRKMRSRNDLKQRVK